MRIDLRLAKQSKGEVCFDVVDYLFNGRPKILPGRSPRVFFVANSILFNVNQPNPKPMTIPICPLDLLLRVACLCNSPLASCGSQQIIHSGSPHNSIAEYRIAKYRIAEYRIAEYRIAEYRIAVRDLHQLCVHTYHESSVSRCGGSRYWGGVVITNSL